MEVVTCPMDPRMKRHMPSELRYLAVNLQVPRFQKKLEEMMKDKEWKKEWEAYCERNSWSSARGTREEGYMGRERGGWKPRGGGKGKPPSYKGAAEERGESESMTALAHNGTPANRQLSVGFNWAHESDFAFMELCEVGRIEAE